jgi:hypothetical protein
MSTLENTVEHELLGQLKAAATELDGVFAGRGRTFVEVGERLGEAIAVFRELTSAFDALPTALANDRLKTGSATLEQVAQECSAIHNVIPGQVQAMESLAGATSDIGKRLGQLHQNIRSVATIAINARIEASNLKRNSQDMLTFTYDAARLAAAAEDTINQYAREQRKARDALAAARAVLNEFDRKHRAQLMSVAGELRVNLASIEGRRTTALSESTHISDRSRHITTSIGAIITALQIADITSQRLAHVHEAVESLIQGVTAGDDGSSGNWWSGLSPEERAALAAEVAALQIGQIDSTLADLRSEAGSIQGELSTLAADAVEMGRQGSALYGSSGTAADSFLGELSGRLDQAGRLLSDCQRAGKLVDELNESVGATFGTLHEQAGSLQGIVGIVGDVRLIGLNAYLKADALGPEGRTLSAISRELRSSADLITGHSRNLIDSMDRTLALFEELKKQNGALGAERLAALDAQMASALAAFQESGTQLASALAMLFGGGDKAHDILHAALSCLDRRDDLETRLEQASKILRTTSSLVGSAGRTSLVRERASSFFEQRYTMASERNIHRGQKQSSQAGRNQSIVGAPQDANDNLDSILF